MQKNKTRMPRVALVTGAARRIGAEIAKTLHDNGFNIALHCHHSKIAAKKLSQQFNAKRPGSSIIISADLCQTAKLKNLIAATLKGLGRLDLLVNNASRFYRTKLGHVKESEWNDLLNTNLKAPFFLAQAAALTLKKHKGAIINITDIHGERPMRDYAAYCISKAGLVMLTKTLAKEWGPEIRVNAIAPGGGIDMPEGANVLAPKVKQKMIERTALKRLGSPRDIANAVLYLATQADYITGQVLSVDGGRSLML
jgi:pteridine reductase